MSNFRTFGRQKKDGGDLLVNLDNIVTIEKDTEYSSKVILVTGDCFITDIAINHIRAEIDPKFVVPQ